MNFRWPAIVILFLTATFSAAQDTQTSIQEESPFKTEKEKASYAIGVDAAKGLQKRGFDLDPDWLAKGFKDAYSGSKLLMSEEEIHTILAAQQKEMIQRIEEREKVLAEKNLKEGEAFLAENKTKEGVVTLASGLQYKILKTGDGRQPTEEDTVEAHYRGTFIDGKEFDSSLKRGQPATFPVKRVIAGWKEALKLMPAGSKWQLFIPSKLAYGTRGTERIGPNSVLIFEVEILQIKPPEEGKERD